MDGSATGLVRNGRRTTATAALATVILLVLAVRYRGVEGPTFLDLQIAAPVMTLVGNWSVPWWAVIRLLGPLGAAVVCAGTTLIAAVLGRRRCAVFAVTAPLATGACVQALQPLVGRTLNGGYALPSGHTTAAVCAALVVTLAASHVTGYRHAGALEAGCVVAATMVMGTVLVTKGLHVPSDVLAGVATAVAVTLWTALAVDHAAQFMSARAASK